MSKQLKLSPSWSPKRTRAKIKTLQLLAKKPLAKMQVCRAINQKYVGYCARRSCYANPRKKRHFSIRAPDCAISASTVRRALTGLEREGKITITVKRMPDPRMPRGWDLMKECALVKERKR